MKKFFKFFLDWILPWLVLLTALAAFVSFLLKIPAAFWL